MSSKVRQFDETRRLKTKQEFESVFKQASKTMMNEFIVLHHKNTGATARLGMAISKKALPKAHERNRIKRIVRESFRKKVLPPLDVVILVKRGIAKRDNTILFKKLSLIWDKLTALYAE